MIIRSDDDPEHLGELTESAAGKCLPIKPKLINHDVASTGKHAKITQKGCILWVCPRQATRAKNTPDSLNFVVYQTDTEDTNITILYGEKIKTITDDVFAYLQFLDWKKGL